MVLLKRVFLHLISVEFLSYTDDLLVVSVCTTAPERNVTSAVCILISCFLSVPHISFQFMPVGTIIALYSFICDSTLPSFSGLVYLFCTVPESSTCLISIFFVQYMNLYPKIVKYLTCIGR